MKTRKQQVPRSMGGDLRLIIWRNDPQLNDKRQPKDASVTVVSIAAGVPTAGQILTALTATTLGWEDPSEVVGPVGGDLSGTLPDPTVSGINGAIVPSSKTVVGTNDSGQIIDATSSVCLTGPTSKTVVGTNSSGQLTDATSAVCLTGDSRLSDSRTPSGTAGGDLSGTYPNPSVAKINGGSTPAPATVLGTNSFGQPVDNTSSVCLTGDSRLSDSRTPSGTAGGDLSGTYPNPSVANINGGSVPASKLRIGTNSLSQIIDVTASSVYFTGAIIGTIDNWKPGGAATTAQMIILHPYDSSTILTGIDSSADTTAGRQLILFNNGGLDVNGYHSNSNSLTIKDHGSTSSAGNQFACPNNVDYTLMAGASVSLVYGSNGFWEVEGLLVAGAAPTGSAGGDLGGAYPNPTTRLVGSPNGTVWRIAVDDTDTSNPIIKLVSTT